MHYVIIENENTITIPLIAYISKLPNSEETVPERQLYLILEANARKQWLKT